MGTKKNHEQELYDAADAWALAKRDPCQCGLDYASVRLRVAAINFTRLGLRRKPKLQHAELERLHAADRCKLK